VAYAGGGDVAGQVSEVGATGVAGRVVGEAGRRADRRERLHVALARQVARQLELLAAAGLTKKNNNSFSFRFQETVRFPVGLHVHENYV